jgi:hypothetical protein
VNTDMMTGDLRVITGVHVAKRGPRKPQLQQMSFSAVKMGWEGGSVACPVSAPGSRKLVLLVLVVAFCGISWLLCHGVPFCGIPTRVRRSPR